MLAETTEKGNIKVFYKKKENIKKKKSLFREVEMKGLLKEKVIDICGESC